MALLAVALLVAAPCRAGTITLSFTSEAGFDEDRLVVRLSVVNRGDAEAQSLRPELRFGSLAAIGEVAPGLAPGASQEWLLELAPERLGPGRWPYSIELSYRDASGSLFHALHAGTSALGSRGVDEIRAELVDAPPVTGSAAIRVSARNAGAEARSVSVTALVPRGMEARVGEPALLEPGEERIFSVVVINRSVPAGSRIAAFAALEYEAEGIHQSLLVPATIEIRGPPPEAAGAGRRTEHLALAGLLGLVWLALVARRWLGGGRPAASDGERPAADRAAGAVRTAVDAGAVLAAVGFVASYFPAALFFAETTTNGGDMASHYYTAAYLRNVLLPSGELLGWCPGNYAGFPFLQLYFPLTFLLMAALSVAMPLQIAFKLVTVLGALLLPVACYWGLRLLGSPYPGPALGALGSLLFLFMEANSMWGGNLPSTLAGEFTFSLALALAVFFVGSLAWTVRTGRGRLGNGVLVALIGFAHGYALLWAGLVSLLELVSIRGWWRRFGTLVVIHGTAILLMGFWLAPLLWYSPWTTAFDPIWQLGSWQEILPPILWPPAVLAVLGSLATAALGRRRREGFPRTLGTLWGAVALSLFFYLTAHSFHVVDIRFMPFLQLVVCLIAADAVARVAARLPARWLWPLVALLAVVPFVRSQVEFIPHWIEWNYSGFESKPAWSLFREINRHLEGDFREPRVAWEHSPAHERFGTARAFESLPHFSGRATLEGVYAQATVTSPFVFYLQSEISAVPSCPLPEWGCGRLDLARGLEHLEMFNVSQLIVSSAEVRRAAAEQPRLRREASFDGYEVYRVVGQDGGYATPLAHAPVLIEGLGWKRPAYRWFKRARAGDPVPVFASSVSAAERELFAGAFAELPARLPARPLAEPPPLAVDLERDRIVVTGAEPGHPILVSVTYHPRWRATTGERVWLAGPGLMLVFPDGERIELVFGVRPVLVLGRLASAAGLGLLVVSLLPVGGRWRRQAAALVARLSGRTPLRGAVASLRATGEWPPRRRRAVLALALGLAVVVLSGFAVLNASPNADSTYRSAHELFDAGRLEEAAARYRSAAELAPLSMTAVHSRYFEAICFYKLERWREAESRFLELVERFPEAPNVADALWHVGLCRERMGDRAGAMAAWERVANEFPHAPTAEYARQRLAPEERDRDGEGGAPGR